MIEITMLETREIPNLGVFEKDKDYAVDNRLGRQLIGQGLAEMRARKPVKKED